MAKQRRRKGGRRTQDEPINSQKAKAKQRTIDKLAGERANVDGRPPLLIPKIGATVRFMGPTGPIVLLTRNEDGYLLEIREPKLGTVLEIGVVEFDTIRAFVVGTARMLWGAELAAEAEHPGFDLPGFEDEPRPCPHCGIRPDDPCCRPGKTWLDYTQPEREQQIDEIRRERIDGTILITEADFARIAGVSVQTARGWRYSGQGLPWIKIGGRVRYRLVDVERMIAEKMIDPSTGAPWLEVRSPAKRDGVPLRLHPDAERERPGLVVDTDGESDPD